MSNKKKGYDKKYNYEIFYHIHNIKGNFLFSLFINSNNINENKNYEKDDYKFDFGTAYGSWSKRTGKR